jgi:hypothetical protein
MGPTEEAEFDFWEGQETFSPLHNLWTSFEVHPDFCTMGNEGCFPKSRVAGA